MADDIRDLLAEALHETRTKNHPTAKFLRDICQGGSEQECRQADALLDREPLLSVLRALDAARDALAQAGDRLETIWDHIGLEHDTPEDRERVAQEVWFGMEEVRRTRRGRREGGQAVSTDTRAAEALARARFAAIPPERHGQLCPCWTRRLKGAGWESCDCWQKDWCLRSSEHDLAHPFADPERAALVAALLDGHESVLAEAVQRDEEFTPHFCTELGTPCPYCTAQAKRFVAALAAAGKEPTDG